MAAVLPTDVPSMYADRYQMEAMLNYSTKPIVFVTNDLNGCKDAVEMAEAVMGGGDSLRQYPLAACYINVTTGLRHNQEALQKLLYLSEKGIPAIYIPAGLGGATAPITMPGTLIIWYVGALVGLVLSQLKKEGAPYILPGWGGTILDMRTSVQPYAAPDERGVPEAMAHFYGLPMFSWGGATDSKCIDQQAAIESALTLMNAALNGGHIVHDVGYIESGMTYSLSQLVICDEIINWLDYYSRGVEITDETLALDVIHEVGPDGQYLDTDHTLKHYKKRWYPNLFNRGDYDSWVAAEEKTLEQRASEQIDRILAEHRPELLQKDIAKRVSKIVKQSESAPK